MPAKSMIVAGDGGRCSADLIVATQVYD